MSLVGFFLPLHTNLPSLLALALAPTLTAQPPVDEPAHDPLDDPQHAIALEPTSGPYAMQPGAPSDLVAPTDPQQLGDKILFVNFDGADMNACGNGPQGNCSNLFFGTVLPYSGDAAKRATVIQIVRTRVEDFGVTVTDTRPGSGDYDMEMVGDWAGAGDQGFAGVAPGPIDCNDARGGQVSFTLEASGTSDGIAEIILQEVAHTWGLEHIDDQTDLLYPTTQGQNKIFKDECLQIVRLEDDGSVTPTGASCGQVHSQFCGSSTMQNSYQELLNLFGPSVPDTAPPTVQILEPADGSTVGPDVNLRIQFDDNQSPVIINATIIIESDSLPETVENDGAYAGPSELDFPINGLPGGVYTVTIDAVDEDDNPASDTVTFTVDGEPPANTSSPGGSDSGGDGSSGDVESSGTGDGGSDSNGSGNNDDDDSDDDDGDGGSAGDTDGSGANDSGDEGCGCTTDTPRPLGWAALSLFGIAAVRRRRG